MLVESETYLRATIVLSYDKSFLKIGGQSSSQIRLRGRTGWAGAILTAYGILPDSVVSNQLANTRSLIFEIYCSTFCKNVISYF